MEREQADAMDAIHDDSDPNRSYCGIDTIWTLPADHPFNAACNWHDQQYNLAKKGLIKGSSSTAVDDEFYDRIFAIAGVDPVLMGEAMLFYRLARVWGNYRWPDAAKK